MFFPVSTSTSNSRQKVGVSTLFENCTMQTHSSHETLRLSLNNLCYLAVFCCCLDIKSRSVSATFYLISKFPTMAESEDRHFWPHREVRRGTSSRKTTKKCEQHIPHWRKTALHATDFCQPTRKSLQDQWQQLNDQRLQLHKEQASFAEEQFNFCILQIAALNQSMISQCDLQLRNWSFYHSCWTQPDPNQMPVPAGDDTLLANEAEISRIRPLLEPISEDVEPTDDGDTTHHIALPTKPPCFGWLQQILRGCGRRFTRRTT